jgi:hypothetical protein
LNVPGSGKVPPMTDPLLAAYGSFNQSFWPLWVAWYVAAALVVVLLLLRHRSSTQLTSAFLGVGLTVVLLGLEQLERRRSGRPLLVPSGSVTQPV